MSHSTNQPEGREAMIYRIMGKAFLPNPHLIMACNMLCLMAMSSMENIYRKMAESAAGAVPLRESAQKFDPAEYIPPNVAHELNNIIAIIRGYADRLLFKHGQDPALEPHLKLISEAAKRAGTVVHDAMPPNAKPAPRSIPSPPPPAA